MTERRGCHDVTDGYVKLAYSCRVPSQCCEAYEGMELL